MPMMLKLKLKGEIKSDCKLHLEIQPKHPWRFKNKFSQDLLSYTKTYVPS